MLHEANTSQAISILPTVEIQRSLGVSPYLLHSNHYYVYLQSERSLWVSQMHLGCKDYQMVYQKVTEPYANEHGRV